MSDNWNYPEGADGPNAPWNEPDPIPCPHCEGTGKILDPDADEPEDRIFDCMECEGSGEVDPRTIEEDDPPERDTAWERERDRDDMDLGDGL
jgi:hypothetical protein